MTIERDSSRRPAFTIGDRLRKARTLAGLDVRPFADEIGISHGTVTRYELETTPQDRMKPLVLKAWAMRTQVDYDWLLNGDSNGVHPPGLEPGTHWLRDRHLQLVAA